MYANGTGFDSFLRVCKLKRLLGLHVLGFSLVLRLYFKPEIPASTVFSTLRFDLNQRESRSLAFILAFGHSLLNTGMLVRLNKV